MRTIILFALAATLGLFAPNVMAQEAQTNEQKIELLKKQKDEVVAQEKAALRKEVEAIMRRRENKEISEAEADVLKNAVAEKAALNIENKLTILDSQIALLERNASDTEEDDGFKLRIGFGERDQEGDRVWGIYFDDDRRGSSRNWVTNHYRRTRSDFVFAFGLNNAIAEGSGINDSPYKIGGSRFAELGWAWTTRVFDNAGWLRVKYGFSFQFNGLKPTDNMYFVKDGDQTVLQEFDVNLDKSKLRMDNLVVPFHFEFGPAKKRIRDDRVSFSTHEKFKIGLGGYAGLNLGTRQKLKFKKDGDRVNEKQKGGFNTNNFVYGLSGYLGWDNMGLYVKYDLNPIFKDNPVKERNVSLGLRFDLD